MGSNFTLRILSPERELYNGEVTELKTENILGHIELLAKHIPMITLLKPTTTEFKESGGSRLKAFTSGGIMKVRDNEVEMLCSAAEWPEEIDANRAEEARKRAEERLGKRQEFDIRRAENALIRAIARLRTKEL